MVLKFNPKEVAAIKNSEKKIEDCQVQIDLQGKRTSGGNKKVTL